MNLGSGSNGAAGDPGSRRAGLPHVLYIASKGRSGSTLVGRLLGAIDGFTYVGELRMAYRDLAQDRLCGCGTRVADYAWRTALAPATRRVVTALSYPLLGRYGYLGAPARSWGPWRPAPGD